MVKVALDVFGGDKAPTSVMRGAVDALMQAEAGSLFIYLVGKQDIVKSEWDKAVAETPKAAGLEKYIEIVNAEEIIEMAESPVAAIRNKKDSSIVVALKMVKEGKADAYVSGGSTGATLAGGQIIVGRQKGVKRPPLAPLVPTVNGACLLLDCGANVDAKPDWLVQFAHMGSIYMESAMGIKNPRVGLLSVGTEEEKGNELTKATYALLKEEKKINFIGNIEARDVNFGVADVVVCDAFAGNVCLKTMEGVSNALTGALKGAFKSTFKSKLGALLSMKVIKKELKKYDTASYGGAPLLGLKGLVVKCHGGAKPVEICNALIQCITFHEQNVNAKIAERIIEMSENIAEAGE